MKVIAKVSANQIKRVCRVLAQHGGALSSAQLADKAGMTVKRVNEIMHVAQALGLTRRT